MEQERNRIGFMREDMAQVPIKRLRFGEILKIER